MPDFKTVMVNAFNGYLADAFDPTPMIVIAIAMCVVAVAAIIVTAWRNKK